MIDDPLLMELFYPFKRTVGLYRSPVSSYSQFKDYVDRNNGIRDCFCSVYPSNLVVDKIFIDIDNKTHPKDVVDVAARLFESILYKGVRVVPTFSGRKGFHIIIRTEKLSPQDCPNLKGVLKAASVVLIASAMGEDPKDLARGGLSSYVDPRTIGDLQRIMRIPNTLRPPDNKLWCVPLPTCFPSMSIDDILEYASEPHIQSYPETRLANLVELAKPIISEFPDIAVAPYTTPVVDVGEGLLSASVIRKLMRPCLWNRINDPNPSHDVRLAATADLLNLGYSPDQLVEFYSRLGWVDFSHELTAKAVKRCVNLHPYSCKTLRFKGIPKVCCSA